MSETITAKVKYLPSNSGRNLALLRHSPTFKDDPADNGNAFLLCGRSNANAATHFPY